MKVAKWVVPKQHEFYGGDAGGVATYADHVLIATPYWFIKLKQHMFNMPPNVITATDSKIIFDKVNMVPKSLPDDDLCKVKLISNISYSKINMSHEYVLTGGMCFDRKTRQRIDVETKKLVFGLNAPKNIRNNIVVSGQMLKRAMWVSNIVGESVDVFHTYTEYQNDDLNSYMQKPVFLSVENDDIEFFGMNTWDIEQDELRELLD